MSASPKAYFWSLVFLIILLTSIATYGATVLYAWGVISFVVAFAISSDQDINGLPDTREQSVRDSLTYVVLGVICFLIAWVVG